jgi:hypothetical protein
MNDPNQASLPTPAMLRGQSVMTNSISIHSQSHAPRSGVNALPQFSKNTPK